MSERNLQSALLSSQSPFAQSLYDSVRDMPIISPHGHVDPKIILENKPFANPAELFIYHDHYITRLLHSAGYSLDELGKSEKKSNPRETWRILAGNWHLFAGTASGYWLENQLYTLFDIKEELSATNADKTFDVISSQLEEDELLPRSILKRFNIEFLATTDDPADDLAVHKAIAAEPDISCRIVPTFRPDKYLDPRAPQWIESVKHLISLTDQKEISYLSFIHALSERRKYFIEHGATSADHGVYEPFTHELTTYDASKFFNLALESKLSDSDARLFAGHMLMEMARMSCEDGLVMTIHAGVLRNHSTATFEKYGADTGHDIPIAAEFTSNLRPLLQCYGLNPNLHLILFCLDEQAVIREIAPLASFYPSVFVGAPWWFFDSPAGIRRFREGVTDIAGFYRGSGFIDDTRAFLSIPARHDMARRIDSQFLADLVNAGRITESTASKIALDLVTKIPTKAFKV